MALPAKYFDNDNNLSSPQARQPSLNPPWSFPPQSTALAARSSNGVHERRPFRRSTRAPDGRSAPAHCWLTHSLLLLSPHCAAGQPTVRPCRRLAESRVAIHPQTRLPEKESSRERGLRNLLFGPQMRKRETMAFNAHFYLQDTRLETCIGHCNIISHEATPLERQPQTRRHYNDVSPNYSDSAR